MTFSLNTLSTVTLNEVIHYSIMVKIFLFLIYFHFCCNWNVFCFLRVYERYKSSLWLLHWFYSLFTKNYRSSEWWHVLSVIGLVSVASYCVHTYITVKVTIKSYQVKANAVKLYPTKSVPLIYRLVKKS